MLLLWTMVLEMALTFCSCQASSVVAAIIFFILEQKLALHHLGPDLVPWYRGAMLP